MPVTPTPAAPKLPSGFDTGASNSDAITSINTPDIVGVAAPGASVILYDSDGTSILGRATADATTGAYSVAISQTRDANGNPVNLDDGAHSLTVTATSPGESASGPSQPLILTVDTQAPDAPTAPALAPVSDTGASALDGVTSATILTFTGQSEPGATLNLYDGAKLVGQTTVAGDGRYSVTTSTLEAGAHSFTASATDIAGNVGKASPATAVTIDTQAPATPPAPTLAAISDTGRSHSDGLTSDTTPMIVGTAEAGAAVVLSDADGTVLGKTIARADGSYAIISETLAAGPHALSVVATDPAGNASAASAPLEIQIDNTPATAEATVEAATASAPSVTFTVHFDQPIADRRGVSPDDFALVATGTAYGDITSVSGSGQTGTVTVTGLGGSGSIALALASGSEITDLAGNPVVLTSTQSHGVSGVLAGDLEPASAGPTGVVGAGRDPSASATGRFVAFDSSFNNAAGLTDVYVKDMQTAGLTKISVAGADGSAADGNSYDPSLSASAGLIAFDSDADNLIADDVGVVSGDNVYAVELNPADPASSDSVIAGAVTLVSAGNGASGSDPDVAPVVSGDGSTIAFSSSQPLVAGVVGGYDNVYVYDVATRALQLITLSTGQNEWDYVPKASPDTTYKPVSYQPGGLGGDGDSSIASISADGTEIAFQSYATDLGAPDLNAADTAYADAPTLRSYVFDIATGKLTVLDGAGVFGEANAPHLYTTTDPQLSADGTEVTYTVTYRTLSSAVFEENLTTGVVTQLTPSPVSGPVGDLDSGATISKTGAYVAYFRNERDYATGGNLIEDDEIVTQSTSQPVTDEAGYTGDTGYEGAQLVLTPQGNAVVFTAADPDGGTEVVEDTLGLTVGVDPIGKADEINATQLAAIKGARSFTVTGHTDAPSGAEVQVQVGPYPGTPSPAVASVVAGDGAWSVSLPAADLGADGDYVIAATVLGEAAASARVTRSFTLDTAAPPTPDAPALDAASNTDVGHDGAMSDTATPTLTGAAEAGSTVTLIDESAATPGLALGTGIADGHGVYAITSAALAQGKHQLAVTATDGAGNVSDVSATLALTIDATTPPAPDAPKMVAQTTTDPITGDKSTTNASAENPDGDGIVASSATPTLSGVALAGATVKLYDSDGVAVLGSAVAGADGSWSVTSSQLTDGLHKLTVTQTTAAGAVSAASDALDLTVDTLPPLSPVITSVGGPLTVNAEHTSQVDVNGTAEPDSTVTLHVDNDTTVSGTAEADGEGDYTINGLVAPGQHKLTVIATDAAGNASQPSAVTQVMVDDPKTPSLTTPAGNPITGHEQDGYIAGATVFADLKGDGTLDPGDPVGVTALDGSFALYGAAGATLIATGGTDIDTGLSLAGALETPAPAGDAATISPLSTLLAALMQMTGLGLDDANAMATAALGINPFFNLAALDVMASYAPTSTGLIQGNYPALVAEAKLLDTATQLSAVIVSASAGAVTRSDAFAAVFKAVAQSVAASGTFDGSTVAGVASILAVAAADAAPGLAIDPALAAATAEIVAAGNAAADAQGQIASGEVSQTSIVANVTAIELVEQGVVAAALANATSGQASLLAQAYTGDALKAQISAEAVAAVPSAPRLSTGSDTGFSNTDEVTTDDAPTFVGTALPGATVLIETIGSYSTGGYASDQFNQIVGVGKADASGHYSIPSLPLSSTYASGFNPPQTSTNGFYEVAAVLPTTGAVLKPGALAFDTPLTTTPYTEVEVGDDQPSVGSLPVINAAAAVASPGDDADDTALQLYAQSGYDNYLSDYAGAVAVYADGGTTPIASGTVPPRGLNSYFTLTTTPLSAGAHTLTLVETTVSGAIWTSAPFDVNVTAPTVVNGAAYGAGPLTGGTVFVQTADEYGAAGGNQLTFNYNAPSSSLGAHAGLFPQDPRATSGADGAFELPAPDATGVIGVENAWDPLLGTPIQGGSVSIRYNASPRTVSLYAPAGISVVTPFSSLIAQWISNIASLSGSAVDHSVAAAESSVLGSLGLQAGQDLLSEDPLAEAQAGDPELFLLDAKLLDTVTLLSPLDGFSFGELAEYLYGQARSDGALNLDDPQSVLAFLQTEQSRSDQTPTALLSGIATIIAASNAEIDSYAAGADDVADLISHTLAAQYVAQTQEAGAFDAAVEQIRTAVLAQSGQTNPPAPAPAIMAPLVAADTGAALDDAISTELGAMVQVTHFAPLDGASTSAASVTFRIAFSQAVGGVTAGSFAVLAPTLADAVVTSVAPAAGGGGAEYDVTVATGAGAGQISLAYTPNGLTNPDGEPIQTGGYQQPEILASSDGAATDAIAVGDLTGDGLPDIVTAARGSETATPAFDSRIVYDVQVFRNEGAGVFAPVSLGVTLPNAVTDLALGDINGDGKLDIVAANQTFDEDDADTLGLHGTLTILPGEGDGTFGAPVSVNGGADATRLAVGDLNGDGHLDIVTNGGAHGQLTVLLGEGDDAFQSSTLTLPNAITPSNVAIADVNGDGHADIVATDEIDGAVDILLGNGDGTFQSGFAVQIGGGENLPSDAAGDNLENIPVDESDNIAVGKLSADGGTDIVTVDATDRTVVMLKGDGDGGFAKQTIFTFPTGPHAANDPQAGTNDFGAAIAAGDTFLQAFTPASVTIADMNGDGVPDLLIGNGEASTVTLLGDGDGTFRLGPETADGSSADSNDDTPYFFARAGATVAADLNGDGRADIVTGGADPQSGLYGTAVLLAAAPDVLTATSSPVAVQRAGLAQPRLDDASSPGALQVSGNAYTLDLGQLTQGSAQAAINFILSNEPFELATDAFTGTFSVAAAQGFSVSGASLPGPLAPGQSYSGLTVAIDTGSLGAHTQTIVFSPYDATNQTTNYATDGDLSDNVVASPQAEGVGAELAPLTLTITDDVTPAPEQLVLIDNDPSNNAVAQGAPAGAPVGLTASATSPDGGVVAYSLAADSSGGGFAIDPQSGVVTVADPTKLNYLSAPGHAYSVEVEAQADGLSTTQAFSIAVAPPAPPTLKIDAVAGDDVVNYAEAHANPGIVLSGSSTGLANAATFTVTVMDGAAAHSYVATVGDGGAWSASIPTADASALADGSASVAARASDIYGQSSPVVTRDFRVAETLPTVTISPVDGDNVLDDAEAHAVGGVAIGGTVSGLGPGATFAVSVADGAFSASYTATVDTLGTGWTAVIPEADGAALPDGAATIGAQVVDSDGNESAAATDKVTVAETLPTVTIAAIGGDNVINAAKAHAGGIALSGTASGLAPGSTFAVSVKDGAFTASYAATVNSDGTGWTATIPEPDAVSLPDGTATVAADAADAYGNMSSASEAITVAETPPGLTIDPVEGDDVLTSAQASASGGVALSGTSSGLSTGTTFAIDLSDAGMSRQYTATVGINGRWTATIPTADAVSLAQGAATLTAQAADAYGNTSAPAKQAFDVRTSGAAEGDVHLTAFDGLHFDFQAVGEFVLAASTDAARPFEVEAQFSPWANLTSVTTEVAASVGDDTLLFKADASIYLDGVLDTVGDLKLAGGSLVTSSGASIVHWAGGESLAVQADPNGYLNLTMVLSDADRPGAVEGLLGHDAGGASDFVLPDGTNVLQEMTPDELAGFYADTWRVTLSGTLFGGRAPETGLDLDDSTLILSPGLNAFRTDFSDGSYEISTRGVLGEAYDASDAFYDGAGRLQTELFSQGGKALELENWNADGSVSDLFAFGPAGSPFGASSTLDLEAFTPKASLSVQEDSSDAFSVLTVSDAGKILALRLTGDYQSSQFTLMSDGAASARIAFHPA